MTSELSPLTRWVRRYFFGWNLLSPLIVGVLLAVVSLIWGNPLVAILAVPYVFVLWIVVDLLVWLLGHPLLWLANRYGRGSNGRNGGPKWHVAPYLQFIRA